MIIVCQKLLKNTKITGITLFPFIFLRSLKDKGNKELINHERIHIRQQLELFIVFFFIWYLLEYLYRYYQYRNWYMAYRQISFEREAYAKEEDFEYLKKRKLFSFWKYR